MGLLLVSCRWWRYPVKSPKPRPLDHTKLRGKNRALYPVRRVSKAECAAYVPEKAKEGHRELKKGTPEAVGQSRQVGRLLHNNAQPLALL
jgi:hypothetical protein